MTNSMQDRSLKGGQPRLTGHQGRAHTHRNTQAGLRRSRALNSGHTEPRSQTRAHSTLGATAQRQHQSNTRACNRAPRKPLSSSPPHQAPHKQGNLSKQGSQAHACSTLTGCRAGKHPTDAIRQPPSYALTRQSILEHKVQVRKLLSLCTGTRMMRASGALSF